MFYNSLSLMDRSNEFKNSNKLQDMLPQSPSRHPRTSGHPEPLARPVKGIYEHLIRKPVHPVSSTNSLLSQIVVEELNDSYNLEEFSGSELEEPESESESSGDEVNATLQINAHASPDKSVTLSLNILDGAKAIVQQIIPNAHTNEQSLDNCNRSENPTYHLCSCFNDYVGESKFNFNLKNPKPIDTFSHFITDEMWKSMVDETNLYAQQYKDSTEKGANARPLDWIDTTIDEMKKFVGIMIVMGLVPLPTVDKYWAKGNIYGVRIVKDTMTRDRFLSLKKFWHFSDNKSNPDTTDRLSKIRNLVDDLNKKFASSLTPGLDLVIDETIIPCCNRLFFHQNIPNKSNKYGIKLYKMCTTEGYTSKVLLYAGKPDVNTAAGRTYDVVMQLTSGIFEGDVQVVPSFLDEGRHVYAIADNFHTSIPLAETLLHRSTRLCGTIKSDRKSIFPEIKKDVNEGECKGVECHYGTKVVYWRDRRVMISTIPGHDTSLVDTGKKNKKNLPIMKPRCVLNYNSAKRAFNVSNQLASNNCCLHKTMKWYRKIALDLITGTAIVNSWFAYQTMVKTRIPLIKYRESVARSLMKTVSMNRMTTPSRKRVHSLRKKEGPARKTRRRCSLCYKTNRASQTVQEAAKSTKQVTTYCEDCPDEPFMCLECFNTFHKQGVF
uniref:PiggyBac transposable element-derived protein domain-containing protein n=1 Tax=Homalodisca liturata TaxID=320908 RepID=A0A1B6J0Q3_9HEMI